MLLDLLNKWLFFEANLGLLNANKKYLETRLARRSVFYGTSGIWRSESRAPERAVTVRNLSRISSLLVSSFICLLINSLVGNVIDRTATILFN